MVLEFIVNKKYFRFNIKPEEFTVFQMCNKLGYNLPCFCYHEKLSIAGNCRICLVEVNNALVASCAMPLLNGMVINTNSDRAIKARINVLEFLLVNHPLDCPICDQGGECDLQDISITFGSDKSRFLNLKKRAVFDLNCSGPLVKTIMTRCIHCTRCVRFVTEVSGLFDLGIVGRGVTMEISNYVDKFVHDELLGNIIDLCPVGALLSMPYSFTNRPWELEKVYTFDILDSLLSSVRIDLSNNTIKRIVPSLDEDVNEEWLSNKARFSYDSLYVQRLNYPKFKLYGKFINISWTNAINLIMEELNLFKVFNIQCIYGPYLSLDSLYALKVFLTSFGCANLSFFESINTDFNYDFRFLFLFNTTLSKLEVMNNIILLGTNPRLEAPLLNSRIRKNFLKNPNFKIYSLGLSINYLTYPVNNLGNSINCLFKFLKGQLKFIKFLYFNDFFNLSFFNVSKSFFNFNLIMGNSILIRFDAVSIINSIYYLFNDLKIQYNNLHILPKYVGRLSAFEVGGITNNISNTYLTKNIATFSYFNSVDLSEIKNEFINKINNFNLYQGFFYIDYYMYYMNLILPSTLYIEQAGIYMNLEGRLRKFNQVLIPNKKILSDNKILEYLQSNMRLHYIHNFMKWSNFFKMIDYFKNLIDYSYWLKNINISYLNVTENLNLYSNSLFYYNLVDVKLNNNIYKSKLNNNLLNSSIINYYKSDLFCKNSKVMSSCALKVKFLIFK